MLNKKEIAQTTENANLEYQNSALGKTEEKIYSIIDKDGNEYAMQSYSLIVDNTLKESDLSNLESKLSLPDGWKFTSRVLDAELLAPANGMAIVIKDDLANSYQKLP